MKIIRPLPLFRSRVSFIGFPVTAEETEGRFVYRISDHSLDIPAYFLLRSNGLSDILIQIAINKMTSSPSPSPLEEQGGWGALLQISKGVLGDDDG